MKDFGLESVEYQRVVCLDPPTPPVAEDDIYGTYDVNSLTFNALDNDTDINGNIDPASFSPLTSLTVAGGTFVNLGNGAIRFEPLQGYSGTATLQYQICDDTPAWEGGPFCDTATITIQVVASPCGPAQYPEGITAYATSVFSENKWKDSDRALGPSDTDFSKSDDDATGWIILDLGGTALIGSEIEFRLASDDGSTYSGTVDAAVNTTGFPNNPIAVSVSVQDPGSVVVSFPVTEAGLRYVRVAGLSKLMLESVQYEMETCTSLPVIDAVVDDFSGTPINGGAGGQAGELTLNDTQDGLPVDAADFNLSIVDNDGLAGASIDAAGNLLVPPGTAAGTYVLSYSICEKSHPSNCDTATATVAVVWPTVITNRRITYRVNKY